MRDQLKVDKQSKKGSLRPLPRRLRWPVSSIILFSLISQMSSKSSSTSSPLFEGLNDLKVESRTETAAVAEAQVQTLSKCPKWEEEEEGGLPIRCSCYHFEEGLFIECPSTGLESVKRSLDSVSFPIKSYTIYQLDSNLTILPGHLFANSSIETLQISYTSLSNLTSETFAGLENSLKKLSVMNSNLREVPQSALSAMKELEALDLDANDVAEVESYAFYGLPLMSLNLQGNKISSLLEYSFGGLENTLEELVLINNRLQRFPLTALRRLRKLRTLKLVGNEITDIPDDGFTRFTALHNLDLSSNRIYHLDDRSFITMPKLVSLSLSSNRLTTLDDKVFVHLLELETLDLSHNSLRTLNGPVFAALRKLRTIDLSYNHLHYLEFGAFHNLPNLRELFLSRNNILKITNGTFWNTTLVTALFLEHNAINEIECGVFADVPHLFQLHFSFNQIREVHPNLFKYNVELRSLSLDNNLIANIHPGTFQELVELRDLRLQKNHLKKVRKGVFYSFPNLQELHLQYNRIEVVENEALQSLANLQYLNMQGNKLIETGDALSKYPSSLRYLQLNNNQIFAIHNESLRGQTQLEMLWLNWNKLQKITRGVFRDLTQIQKIYLDHNELSSIESGSFGALSSLVYLNLEYNNLNHLSADLFGGASGLTELYLSHNHIMDVEPNSFQSMRSLQKLHLSHNQIYVVRKYMFEGNLAIEELNLSNIMAEEIESGSFLDLSALRVLDISENNLSSEKIDFLFLPHVEWLKLSANNLTGHLKADIFHGLSRVEHLDLSETGFNLTLNARQLEQLEQVQELDLSRNGIREVTATSFPIGRTLGVRQLVLQDNELQLVPEADVLGLMPSLEVISLSGNKIKRLEKAAFGKNPKVRRLDLSGNSLSVLDAQAFLNLTSLQQLDLSNNVIRSIGAGVFEDVVGLQEVNLDNNWFQYLPNHFLRSALPGLTLLTVSRNPILRVREDLSILGGFPELRRLSINQGNLSIIASHDFFGFSALEVLSLRSNHISKISPGSFRPLRRLSTLDLGENELEILPEERLSGLGLLLTLNLTENHLLEMPSFSPDLLRLKHLDVSFNRLTRIDTFGHLGDSVTSIVLRNNIIGWIAINAFQNLSALQTLDLRTNFVTHLGDTIFSPVEVTLETLLLAGNPFHCDCRLLGLWEWLQDHSRLLSSEGDIELLCVNPEKLKDHLVLSLHPADFCPVPLIAVMEVFKLESNRMTIRWDVQNDTLVGGFTLDYHLTSDRVPVVTNRRMGPSERFADVDDLKYETWYTVCVQANGRFLRTLSNKPTPYVVDHQRNYGEYVTSNRKCIQAKTLAHNEKTKISLSTLGIIVGGCICAVFIITLSILLTTIKFRRRRRPVKNDVPEEYITYRHFSLPSSENVYS